MDKVRVLFILPKNCKNPSDASEIMTQAFESCRQNVVNVSWIEETNFDSTDFSKTDFVIFEKFENKQFESLKDNKCARIMGPWCLLVCLMEGRPIPNFTWPIYNVAMYGCVVTCSHLPKARKLEIKEKVQLMGGCCTDSLMTTNTHLITESVKSEKYLQGAEAGLKLMVSQWVDVVWEASCQNNVHCDDEQFSNHKCLPFHKLTICSTGFSNTEMRSQVAQNVARNGGVFTASLSISKTDILIVYGVNGVISQKYKAARTHSNIHCVTVEWIYDSIEKGYALPHNLYSVKKDTSTPTKDDAVGPDFSIISAIGDTSRQKTTLEETAVPGSLQITLLRSDRVSSNKRKCTNEDDVNQLISGLDIKKAKRAGQYLDGCSVYVAGFKPEQREKLCKILNLSGATRYDVISDRLTHIIVGDLSCPEVKIIKSKNHSITLVSIHWLLDCIDKQQMLDEEKYLISFNDCEKEELSSPLGRKALTLLTSNNVVAADHSSSDRTLKVCQGPETEKSLIKQYLDVDSKDQETDTLVQLLNANSEFNTAPNIEEKSKPLPDNSSLTQSSCIEEHSTHNDVFYLKTFVLVNFEAEEYDNVKKHIESACGTVKSKGYKRVPDLVVAPLFITSPLQISGLEVINNLWIFESIEESEERPVLYYHRPLLIKENNCLENCVVTVSGYMNYERTFLKELIEALGGISQDQFARVKRDDQNILPSTHLLSLEADGKKYQAALKWGIPVVNKDWLFECAKIGKLAPADNFLVGETSRYIASKSAAVATGTPSTLVLSSSKKSVLTPVNQKVPLNISKTEFTPMNGRLFGRVADTPAPCSQVTPINKVMEEIRKTNLLGTPQTPPLPKSWHDVNTPDSPFGAAIKSHMSPKGKKELLRYINCIPDCRPPVREPLSTPLSEVKRRCWKKLLNQQESPSCFPSTSELSESQSNVEVSVKAAEVVNQNEINTESDTQNVFINNKLKQIEEMANAMAGSRRTSRAFQSTIPLEVGVADAKDTQPCTVGWDYNEDDPPNQVKGDRIFIISGVEKDLRPIIVKKIERLGAQVSDLSLYDPNCTHLICPKLARNEKTLSCMAAGKWILHISYVDASVTAGRFLDEEDFEFGNSKAKKNIQVNIDKDNEFLILSVHWWRKEISRRGYGAFNDMRAIVVAQKRDPLIRVIEAGGGQVVEAKPPFESTVHATHCLLEPKSVPNFNVYIPLAQQGVLCINTHYISDFLYRTNKDIKDAILPHFVKFYS